MLIKYIFDAKKLTIFFIYLSFFYSTIMLFIGSFQPLRTDDLFWHIKVGEVLTDNKSFPRHDPFLFTQSSDIKPLYHEWLFQVFTYNIFKITNLYFLRFVHLFIIILILLFLWRFLDIFNLQSLYKACILSLFILFSYQRLIQFRPHLFSILFFYIMMYNFISGEEDFNKKRILISIIISIIWCNMHSVALVIFHFWFVFIISAKIFKKLKNECFFDFKGQLIGFFSSLAIMSVNPMGLNYFIFYLIGNKRNPYKFVIDEWGRFNPFTVIKDFLPLSSPYLIILFSILLITIFIYIVLLAYKILKKMNAYSFREIYMSLFSFLSIGLMFYAVRFTWLSLIPLILLICILRSILSTKKFLKNIILSFFSILAFLHFDLESVKIYTMPLNSINLIRKYFEWDLDKVKYLNSAVSFLKQNKIKGNIFNPYYMGGFISFNVYPEMRIFFDGRFENYSQKVNIAAYDIKFCKGDFTELIKHYNINYFLVPCEASWNSLRKYLSEYAICIYKDNLAEIYKI